MITEIEYRNRRAVSLDSGELRVTVLVEGGHVAEIFHKQAGVNPLWTPPWPSIEPSTYDEASHPQYGRNAESRLLSGIMGHNLCMDIFGGPSEAEAAAGLDVHGEVSSARFAIAGENGALVARTELPAAGLGLERRIQIAGTVVRFHERVENLRAADHPIGWTQHVTLGPPFLDRGITQFRAPGTKGKVYEDDFAGEHGRQKIGAEFDWPLVPLRNGGTQDLRVLTDADVSGGFTTTLMDPAREQAFFLAHSPTTNALFGYVWKQSDFPWLGIWEENHARTAPPWNGEALTLGMEFGVSPMPESRRQMIERGGLFGAPGFRWIPAKSAVEVEYCAFLTTSQTTPEEVEWDGANAVAFHV
ncbi:MAG: hypothetical protein GY953_10060 [bacterium]|nr:hypothetical protein [bacterium]